MVHRELNMASRLFGVLKNRKVTAQAGSITVAGGLIASSSVATGAFFSDTKNGTITGTLGTVKIQTSGGSGTDGLDFAFNNLLPGVAQTANVHFKDTGVGNQDIYLVFPNATALSALNNLGTFGEIHIGSNGSEILADANRTTSSTMARMANKFQCSLQWFSTCPLSIKVSTSTNSYE